ncbi:MAG: hypothetical protein GTO63_31365 [Anaerolineae bacterium]|nr:hypothetical protein [Anaerolineae bacterium]NIN99191.1 hypothetical protein [Anaerolineae bacterium]NIQ82032.1 hypothetical protein [Anaerolineae bacterium]
MKVRHRFPKVVLPLVLLALIIGALSCATPVETGPRAWIDWPLDGYEVEPGSTVSVICHAFAQEGVAEVHLAVDRNPYRIGQPAQLGEQFVDVSIDWLATEPGVYLLSVTAFDTTGAASTPADVTVRVLGEVPTPLLTPTELATPVPPIETPPPPTASSPSPTGTALPPTASPPPATATPPPPPPTIVSFEASRTQVMAGECVRFTWRVEGYPTAIYFDGEGVTSPDSRDRCPTAAGDFELRAEGPTGVDTATVHVNVTQPPSPTPDTQGPSAPSLVSPTGGTELPCDDVTLDWNPVSDPSGIDIYYVKVEREITPGNWQTAGGSTATGTEVTRSLGCGISYRWSVRAEDGVGNVGPWSSWGQFGVELP